MSLELGRRSVVHYRRKFDSCRRIATVIAVLIARYRILDQVGVTDIWYVMGVADDETVSVPAVDRDADSVRTTAMRTRRRPLTRWNVVRDTAVAPGTVTCPLLDNPR